MTPKIVPVVGEVALSQVVPLSVDLTMFPDLPTPTNTPEPEEVVVVSSVRVVVVPEELELSFLEHEMTVKLKREIIIMSKIFFIRSSIPSFFCLPPTDIKPYICAGSQTSSPDWASDYTWYFHRSQEADYLHPSSGKAFRKI